MTRLDGGGELTGEDSRRPGDPTCGTAAQDVLHNTTDHPDGAEIDRIDKTNARHPNPGRGGRSGDTYTHSCRVPSRARWGRLRNDFGTVPDGW